jgi:hypothetical protein
MSVTAAGVGLGLTGPAYQLQLSTDSAAKLSTSAWTVSSDSRLKTNIENADISMCYNNIKNIPLKRYTWRDDIYTVDQVPDRNKIGWIADDIEAYFPKAVTKKSMYGYEDCRDLNADQIYAAMYGAVQKLIANTEQMADQIANKNVTLDSLNVAGTTQLQQVGHSIRTKTSATGTVTHDWSTGAIFYHSSISENFTANITNLPTTALKTYTVTLIINQHAIPYYANAIQIAGSAQTINWSNGSPPTPGPNKKEIQTFTIMNTSDLDANPSWIVLGDYRTYG